MTAPFRFPRFFVTSPAPCPYLPGRLERKVFTELRGQHAGELNDALGRIGFRRSQSVAYRPSCVGCTACVSVRVVASEFRANGTQRKLTKRNADLEVTACRAWATEEQFALLRRYLAQRHPGGGMVDMDSGDYADMVEHSPVDSFVLEYREPSVDGRPGRLVGCCLTDQQADGLSMIYSFYDAELPGRAGLGDVHHPRPYRAGAIGRPWLCVPRLLGEGLGADGVQNQVPAAGSAGTEGLDAAGRRGCDLLAPGAAADADRGAGVRRTSPAVEVQSSGRTITSTSSSSPPFPSRDPATGAAP